jgi:hypothetical protein
VLANIELIIAFISAMASSLAGSTINNYINGIRTWHIIHYIAWSINYLTIKMALQAAIVSALAKLSEPPRQPIIVEYLRAILSHLDKTNLLDMAIVACITTTFWLVSKLGEFTIKTISQFDCKKHIITSQSPLDHNCNRLQVCIFNLPFTKMSKKNGKATFWAKQLGPTNLWQAFKHHQHVNTLPLEAYLFAYKVSHQKVLTLLTKHKLIEHIKAITMENDLSNFERYGLHIGGTLEYLLRGIPFEAVQAMG